MQSKPGEPAVIGPRLPHYVSWAPTGRVLSYVAATPAGLAHFVVPIDALDAPKRTVLGAPLFSAWAPAGDLAIVHAGDRLLRVDAALGEAEVIATAAVGFRTPAISSDGRLLSFARGAGEGIEVCLGSPTGTTFEAVRRYAQGLVLAFRPGHHALAVATTADPNTGVFDSLQLLPLEQGEPRTLWRGPFVCFAWAPQGDSLVLVVPTQMGDGRYALYCLGADGTFLGATEALVPSDETRSAFAFFDQYLQSHCAWSPDGAYFGIAGRGPGDGVSGSFGDPSGPFAYLWKPGAGAPLTLVGMGTFVSFPPPA
jgi:hypothetical protein